MARSRLSVSTHLRPGARLLGAGLSALVLAVAGCDSGTQAPDAPAPEAVEYSAPAAAAPKAASNQADQPPVQGFEAAIPSNFPSDVPVPPDARPVLGRGANIGGAERSGVQLLTDKSPQDVVAYYQNELSSGGWEIGESPSNSISATRGSSTVMLFAVPDPSGGTSIYMITEEGGQN
jgi:hypothetical protein